MLKRSVIKNSSDHEYLPTDSESWEFFYITLFGDEVFHCYEKVPKEIGHILKVDVYSPPIQSIFNP